MLKNDSTVTENELAVDDTLSSRKKRNTRAPKGKHPIEIEYWHVLPAIRRELAQSLLEFNLKQREVAEILGITEAAVSQYKKGSRGKLEIKDEHSNIRAIPIPTWLAEEIRISAKRILESHAESDYLRESNRIMQVIRERPRDFLCRIHEVFGEKVDNCEVCIEK